jgi:hypothetical protein
LGSSASCKLPGSLEESVVDEAASYLPGWWKCRDTRRCRMLKSVLRRCRGLSEGYDVVVIANIARIGMAERGKVDGQVPGVVQVDANNSPGTRTSTVRRGTMDEVDASGQSAVCLCRLETLQWLPPPPQCIHPC